MRVSGQTGEDSAARGRRNTTPTTSLSSDRRKKGPHQRGRWLAVIALASFGGWSLSRVATDLRKASVRVSVVVPTSRRRHRPGPSKEEEEDLVGPDHAYLTQLLLDSSSSSSATTATTTTTTTAKSTRRDDDAVGAPARGRSSASLQPAAMPRTRRGSAPRPRIIASGDTDVDTKADADANAWELLRAELKGRAEGTTTTTPRSKGHKTKVLVVVPGLGEAGRVNGTLRSLEALRQTTAAGDDNGDGGGFACLVYVYKADILDEVKGRMQHLCHVLLNAGFWTSHMKSVPPLTGPPAELRLSRSRSKSSTTSLEQAVEGVTHVAILMDDVGVGSLHLSRFVALMGDAGFGVASPAFNGDWFEGMHRRNECAYHRTDFVNVMLAVYTRQAWECWQGLVDPAHNMYGWGMDVAMSTLCGTPSGILDAFQSHHPRARRGTRTYPAQTAKEQMEWWLENRTGVPRDRVGQYKQCVTQRRPLAAFPRCELYRNGTRPSRAAAVAATSVPPPGWDCASEFQQRQRR